MYKGKQLFVYIKTITNIKPKYLRQGRQVTRNCLAFSINDTTYEKAKTNVMNALDAVIHNYYKL